MNNTKKNIPYSEGEWEIRGNQIFIKGTYKSIATIHVQDNYEQTTFKPKTDHEANANAALMVKCTEMYELLRKQYELLQNGEALSSTYEDVENIFRSIR